MYEVIRVVPQELVRMAELMCWDEAIASQVYGWGLFSITASMGNPCTHGESRELAQQLVRELTGDPSVELTPAARLHYALPTGGLRPDMQTNYHPARFHDRIMFHSFTGVGEWRLSCTDHATDHDSCLEGCQIGVQRNGQYLIDIVRAEV